MGSAAIAAVPALALSRSARAAEFSYRLGLTNDPFRVRKFANSQHPCKPYPQAFALHKE